MFAFDLLRISFANDLLIFRNMGTGSVGWDAKESVDFSGNFSNLRMKQMTGGILDYGSTQTDLSVLFLQ